MTHKEGSGHGNEHDFVVVPERICSKDKKTWTEVIGIVRILQRKDMYIQNKRLISC
jgi:hypothetical protein